MHVSVVGEVLVDLVGDDPDAVLVCPLPDCPDLVGRIDSPRRVGRRNEEQRLGVRAAGRLQLVDGDPKARGHVGLENHARSTGEGDALRIGGPVGGRKEDLVAGVQQGCTRVVDGVLAAVGHQHLGNLRAPPRVTLGLLHQCRLQFRQSARRRILVVDRVLTGRHGSDNDVVRCGEIGLTSTEPDDRLTGRPQLPGLVGHGHGRRLGDGTDTGG